MTDKPIRSAYFLAVRALVNDEDPIGLIALGAPEDEYDPEVEDIVKWRKATSPEQVVSVFRRWFGEDQGDVSVEMAARIADGANYAREQHLIR